MHITRGKYRTLFRDRIDYATLCDLVSGGMSDKTIAGIYEVTPITVYRLRKEWGIHKPPNPEKYDWGMVKRMLESNLTYKDIAYIYESTPRAIISYVSRKRKEEQSNEYQCKA